eukprot:3931705-Rhodomonas_salina.1
MLTLAAAGCVRGREREQRGGGARRRGSERGERGGVEKGASAGPGRGQRDASRCTAGARDGGATEREQLATVCLSRLSKSLSEARTVECHVQFLSQAYNCASKLQHQSLGRAESSSGSGRIGERAAVSLGPQTKWGDPTAAGIRIKRRNNNDFYDHV